MLCKHIIEIRLSPSCEIKSKILHSIHFQKSLCSRIWYVFVRLFSSANTLDLKKPSSLLWNTATRLCLNRIRDKHRHGLDKDSSELLLKIACAEDEQSEYETKNILARLFSKEPESSRTIAVLHYVDGLTLEETAREVSLSVSGVRKRLRALKAKIKNLEVKE